MSAGLAYLNKDQLYGTTIETKDAVLEAAPQWVNLATGAVTLDAKPKAIKPAPVIEMPKREMTGRRNSKSPQISMMPNRSAARRNRARFEFIPRTPAKTVALKKASVANIAGAPLFNPGSRKVRDFSLLNQPQQKSQYGIIAQTAGLGLEPLLAGATGGPIAIGVALASRVINGPVVATVDRLAQRPQAQMNAPKPEAFIKPEDETETVLVEVRNAPKIPGKKPVLKMVRRNRWTLDLVA